MVDQPNDYYNILALLKIQLEIIIVCAYINSSHVFILVHNYIFEHSNLQIKCTVDSNLYSSKINIYTNEITLLLFPHRLYRIISKVNIYNGNILIFAKRV